MLSYQRYQGEADMALSARNAAGTDAEWMAYDQAWEALITAGPSCFAASSVRKAKS